MTIVYLTIAILKRQIKTILNNEIRRYFIFVVSLTILKMQNNNQYKDIKICIGNFI